MWFLSPLYLFGAIAIALPIVLHLLRRDVAPQVPFTAVRLLRGTPTDRSRGHRLRDLLLLAARVASLVLLASAFARPYLTGASGRGGATVVVLDRSFSMGAAGVFNRARDAARAAIDEAGRAGDRVALVTFDDGATATSPLGSAADARAALASISPGLGGTRYAPALDKAAEILVDEPHPRLVLVSDLQRGGFDGASVQLPTNVQLVVSSAPGAAANLAVTDVRAVAGHPVATIRNYGSAAVNTRAALETSGREVLAQAVVVPGGSVVDVTFAVAVPEQGFSVSVDDPGGYAADNRRFADVANAQPPRILIAGGGPVPSAGFFVSRALAASDGAPEFEVKTVTGTALSAASADELKENAVIAVLSTHGLDRRAGDALRRYLQSGGGLFVAAAPDVDATVLSALLEWQPALATKEANHAGVLAVSDVRHPIFRPFDGVSANFGQVEFQHAWSVDPANVWTVLARFTDGAPALLERVAGAGRVLLFTSDVDRRWNDFPLHPSFVPFVQEAVRYLGARRSSLSRANDIDLRESSVDYVTPEQFAHMVTRSAAPAPVAKTRAAEQAEARQGYWRDALMLMFGVLIAEAFVGSR